MDVLGKVERLSIKVGEYGEVTLIDVMPRLIPTENATADYAIAEAARVSYGEGTKQMSNDETLIRYLMRHSHTSPFEMCELKFYLNIPIVVARQIIRHRTASVNEYSARYSTVKDQFFVPSEVRKQSTSNRQGSEGEVDPKVGESFIAYVEGVNQHLYESYMEFMEKGVTREQARMVLPLTTYTRMYWKIDLHNFFHFVLLRMDEHAQKETRDFARAMYELAKQVFPISCKAFEEYHLNAVKLTMLEVQAIQSDSLVLNSPNARERQEWEEKKKHLFGVSGWGSRASTD